MTDAPILLTSRSFAEYVAFFDLDAGDLPRRIVDVSAGASNFVAEAAHRGVHALDVDPAYRDASMWTRLHQSVTDGAQLIAAHSDHFVYDWYATPARRAEMRHAAMENFLADYQSHPDRYQAAALPGLPLATGSYDLALCSHLLFTWAEVFDELWHLAALIELARVADEVRVYPLVLQGNGTPVAFVDSLRTRLLEGFGIHSHIERVPYEFQRGACHMLRLCRRSDPETTTESSGAIAPDRDAMPVAAHAARATLGQGHHHPGRRQRTRT